ncbi:response regulator transcription factor [uncultured Eubacterium sp.]|uniref:response regulator transcription factor n=1 Tax=uncultured Eubacterium sp. TaxID=165185 RepID=UPI00260E86EF|nr:response regulator transcription factor [uncultured Eubacterium sp.]
MYRVLVADDEKAIRESISDYLRAKGFSVAVACDGKETVEKTKSDSFDLLILDVRMPNIDGLNACKLIREFSLVPILFLSAYGEEDDFLNAYKVGCDDYIVKPFPLSVLVEKCNAMIKRNKSIDTEIITVGSISIDAERRKVFTPESVVNLSNVDFELLLYLCRNKGIALNRDIILTRVWGYDFDGDARVVDTHIKRIRKALGRHSAQIKTISGVGYSVEEV